MELNSSLRSLEAAGRPSGTGRPSLPSSHENGQSRAERDAPVRREAQEHRADPREAGRTASERREARAQERAERSQARKPRATGPQPSTGGDDAPFERELEAQTRTATSATPKNTTAPATPIEKAGARNGEDEARSDGVEALDAAAEPLEGDVCAVNPARRVLLDETQVPSPQTAVAADAAFVAESEVEPGVAGAEAETAAILGIEGETSDDEPALTDPVPPANARALPASTGAVTAERGAKLETAVPRDPAAHAAGTQEANPSPQHPQRADETRASEVLRQVRVAITPELKHAVIHLHPAELGRISIQLTIEDEGLVARVRAEKREAIDALEKHLPELRAALSRQGLQTQQFDLALGFHDERKPDDPRAGRPPHERGRVSSDAVNENDEPVRHVRRMLSEGAIDTYA